MVTWEWEVWRSFDNTKETFEEKGWEFRYGGRDGNEMMLLVAESDDHVISFFDRDSGTGECWFELRDKNRRRVVFVRGAQNIPTPKRAIQLLADYGTSLGEIRSPRELPLYSLPVAPLMSVAEAG